MYKAVIYVFIFMGLVHLGISPLIFDDISIRMGWFLGAGFMGIFLGIINYLNYHISSSKLIMRLSFAANITSALYAFFVAYVDTAIPSFIMLSLIVIMTFYSVFKLKAA